MDTGKKLEDSNEGFLTGRGEEEEEEEEEFPYYFEATLPEPPKKRTLVWEAVMSVAEDVGNIGDDVGQAIHDACHRLTLERSGGSESDSLTVDYLRNQLGAPGKSLLSSSVSSTSSEDEITAELESYRKKQREEFRKRLATAPVVSHSLPHAPTPVKPSAELLSRLDADEVAPARKKILLALPVSLCCREGTEVICLSSHMSPAAALDVLAQNGILSAPVRHHRNKKVIGSLDVLDLVTYVLDLLKENSELEMERAFEKNTISALAKKNASKFMQLDMTDNLYRAFQLFSAGVHRIHVVSGDRMVDVLSQSSIIDLLLHEPLLLGEKGEKTLEELHAARPRKNLFAVHTSAKTYVAFDLMTRHNISAVPIVTAENKLVGTLEACDIKGMHLGTFILLTYGVKEYVDVISRQERHFTHGLATIRSSQTLLDAVKILSEKRTHRLWVVSDDGKLKGLLSLGDLLHCISAIEETD